MNDIATFDFSGKKALIRVDFNVPLDKETFSVTDNTRIKAAWPTIQQVLDKGGSVVLMSHLGRPKSGPEDRFSLKHIVAECERVFGHEVNFVSDSISEDAFEASAKLQPGQILLLENLRFYPHEKSGDRDFAKKLSQHGNLYINDAFGTAHRAHASTAVISDFFPEAKMFGTLINKEIESISKVLDHNQSPVTAIVGGAKVSSKIEILENLINKVDNILIGGGMAYTFAKAQGGVIGNSLVEDDYIETAKEILANAKTKNVNILLPEDTIAANAFSNDAEKQIVNTAEIPDGWMGMDIGEKSMGEYADCIENSKTILWNGPMGVFEMANFQHGTKKVALAVVKATQKGAFSLIGGGDSVAAINKFELSNHVSHVSTGGGAMLEYLEGKELPGIKAILD